MSGLTRNTIDKFYTCDTTVNICSVLLQQHLFIDPKNDIIIEPSAGAGAFIPAIKSLSQNYIFYDTHPEHCEIHTMDYLETQPPTGYSQCHVIGNPPFGRQSSIAIKFIKKSCMYCDTISFILPKSFRKISNERHFPGEFHKICDYELPQNSFTLNSTTFNVPCVFQIWERRHFPRYIQPKQPPYLYKFVKKTQTPDISFRRVGVYAGRISRSHKCSEQSHYFIKFDFTLSDELYDELKKIEFESSENTVGPKSISKQELIVKYNSFTHQNIQ